MCEEIDMTAASGSSRVIDETASLGMGILVVESEDGAYKPISTVDTIREARELAAGHMAHSTRRLERGGDPLCPSRYVVWAQGATGDYAAVADIEA
jgi:hypothetical protein